MQTREEIRARVKDLLVELFEVEPEAITGDAKLYDDLDIDSIDAVDLIVELRKFMGKKIAPEVFKSVRSVDDVVEAVYALIHEQSSA